ncbi:MAG: hypothetical protein IIA64_04695 [Planctomycetes bacterium]|nr:hypothetical protein [Planctomycetota bacterium]
MKRRSTVVSILRGTSLFFALWIPVPLVSWLGEGIRDGDFFNLFYYAGSITRITILVLISGACVLFARPLSKWIVPIAEPRCPRCDHTLRHLVSPRCSECGLKLPDELVQDEPPQVEPPPRR